MLVVETISQLQKHQLFAMNQPPQVIINGFK